VAAKVDAALEALTLQQVNAALRLHLQPEALVTGVAGDFGKN
jgi:zinc protease